MPYIQGGDGRNEGDKGGKGKHNNSNNDRGKTAFGLGLSLESMTILVFPGSACLITLYQ